MNPRPERELRLTPEDYVRVHRKWAELTSLTDDEEIDGARFCAWLIEEFQLEPGVRYRIVLAIESPSGVQRSG